VKKVQYSIGQKTAAWAVHTFTASGIVAGFWGIVSVANGDFFMAFAMLFLTVIIDGLDGTFARMFNVTEVLPDVSGKTMDYVIDFVTYAIVPAYIIYAANIDGQYLIPDDLRFVTATIILLISTLYYGKEGMVSNDMYFVGFPVMWNLVAFYLYYVTNLPAAGNFILVLVFAVLHFVPIKYLYPSRTKKFQKLNILATVLLLGSNFTLLVLIEWKYDMPTELIIARTLSVVTLLYFGVLSIYHTWFDEDTKNI
jgi:phosphatidylcholine synthase